MHPPRLLTLLLTIAAASALLAGWQHIFRPSDQVEVVANSDSDYAVGALIQDSLRNGQRGPMLVVIPPGQIILEHRPKLVQHPQRRVAGSTHHVHISYPLAVAQMETSVAEFKAFITDTNYQIDPGCWHHGTDQEWREVQGSDWRSPGYAQSEDFPVTCLNWVDVEAYVEWLREQTGQHYRLPSEAEFEYFNRADALSDYPFDIVEFSELCAFVNGADQSTKLPYANKCNDGFAHASPRASFEANGFGLYDTSGNVWEFTRDCWNDAYQGSWRTLFRGPPTNGSAWRWGRCGFRVMRGGSFLSSTSKLRLGNREQGAGSLRLNRVGFRVVRNL